MWAVCKRVLQIWKCGNLAWRKQCRNCLTGEGLVWCAKQKHANRSMVHHICIWAWHKYNSGLSTWTLLVKDCGEGGLEWTLQNWWERQRSGTELTLAPHNTKIHPSIQERSVERTKFASCACRQSMYLYSQYHCWVFPTLIERWFSGEILVMITGSGEI